VDRVEFIEGSPEAIASFNRVGIPVAVLTNQAGVARGFHGIEDVADVHRYIANRLAEHGAHIDLFVYCPYHPEGVVEAFARASEDASLHLAVNGDECICREHALVAMRDPQAQAVQFRGVSTIRHRYAMRPADKFSVVALECGHLRATAERSVGKNLPPVLGDSRMLRARVNERNRSHFLPYAKHAIRLHRSRRGKHSANQLSRSSSNPE
jgi:hypothetical protein